MKHALLLPALFLALLFPLPSNAKTIVHLNSGEEIEALSAWQSGDTVYVLRNRDILLEFDKSEVNLSKSRIRKGPAPARQKQRKPLDGHHVGKTP